MSLGTEFSNISLKHKLLENEHEREITEVMKSAQNEVKTNDEAIENDNDFSDNDQELNYQYNEAQDELSKNIIF
jgi:hypothetical protein